ncbi:NAD(P)/FAD-dependent oxidoreductase [Roseovarius dicentrarchi]|uniref:NAD(P)/FAD-dependent oxidoreductase n=1 Tax=Roseovarius dicentrarchi TaxID=2250573 RepID=UPI000DEAC3E6|nr:NAD(P)/FAD-dependent oxidoreductase [Roseovarius dicentrarchi]
MSKDITIIGGGFAGLSAGYDLTRAGHRVTVLEADDFVGGLAGAFEAEGERLDRFYHHWFTNDLAVMGLIDDLGLSDEVMTNPTNTGVYYNSSVFKLSTPMDLLKFSPLPFFDRIRLGLLTLRARKVKDWMALEHKTASEWLRELGGERVYKVMWEPLLQGKFGPYAEDISAVWFWNKLKLRGGSRGKAGEERLAYFQGSFARLAEATADGIRAGGGKVHTRSAVDSFAQEADGRWRTKGAWGEVTSDAVIATTALPLVADMIEGWAAPDYLAALRRINYLSNVCLVLELDRSLSDTYWLNVNDPSFPYVGVIEHTNFMKPETYGGNHVVYLSKYLPHQEALYNMSAEETLEFSLPHLKKMFPEFDASWINRYHVWKARWAQPVVEKEYAKLIPSEDGPLPGMHICSMAQIYPEDRGTNYAIREGRALARRLAGD